MRVARAADLSEAQAAVVVPLMELLVEDTLIYEVLDTANKAALAQELDGALEAAMSAPTEENLRAYAEAYCAHKELERYGRFLDAARSLLSGGELDQLLSRFREPAEEAQPPPAGERLRWDVLGMELELMTTERTRELGLHSPSPRAGLLVTAVDRGSLAERARVETGMVLYAVQHRAVFDRPSLEDNVRDIRPETQARLGLWVPFNGRWERHFQVVPASTAGTTEKGLDTWRVTDSSGESFRLASPYLASGKLQLRKGAYTIELGLSEIKSLQMTGATTRNVVTRSDQSETGLEVQPEREDRYSDRGMLGNKVSRLRRYYPCIKGSRVVLSKSVAVRVVIGSWGSEQGDIPRLKSLELVASQ